jgi:hypothetical protein
MRSTLPTPRPAAARRTRLAPIIAFTLAVAALLGVIVLGAGLALGLILSPGAYGALLPLPESRASSASSGATGPIGASAFPYWISRQPAMLCTDATRNSAGQSVTVNATERICGNVTVYAGSATVLGEVDGDVTVVGGNATIAGDVLGNVTTVGGSISIESAGRVQGNVHALGGQVTRAPNSYVGGRVERDLSEGDLGPRQWLGLGFSDHYTFPWLSVLLWAGVGALLVSFFPEQLGRVRSIARRDFPKSVMAGALAAVVGGALAVLLVLTCLGIPVALLIVAGLWIAWVVGTVALGFLVGDRLLNGSHSSGRSPVAATVLGLVLIALVESIPCLGGAVSLVAGAAGLGAALLALLNARRPAYHHWRAY